MDTRTGTIIVDDQGAELFFTDTGPVPGSPDYTTLVVLHGSGFNGAVFRKLLPFSAAANIRLVLVHRRPYAPSSTFAPDELADLAHGRTAFMARLGAQLARFLRRFAEAHDVPRISPDRRAGGLALMGWSMGCAVVLAFLGQPEAVGCDTYAALEPYMRKVILFDPPSKAYGYMAPEGAYSPWTDPLLPDTKSKLKHFGKWVSTYYDHILSRTPADLDMRRLGSRSSLENISPADFAAMSDPAAASTEMPWFAPGMQRPVILEQTERALFAQPSVLPGLEIVHLSCEASHWEPVWTAMETERRYAERVARGDELRRMRFRWIPDANHFVHWDEPEKFWRAVIDVLRE